MFALAVVATFVASATPYSSRQDIGVLSRIEQRLLIPD
jgi:hypothetical protein